MLETNSIVLPASFGKLIGHKGQVSSISVKDFDKQGKYANVLKAVDGEGEGMAIFKFQHDSTRSEIYIVTLNAANERVVGLKALSIES